MAHSNWAEWIYLGVVTALLVYVGAEAWNVERIIDHAPEDAEIIKVTAQQWLWTFEHEDGTKEVGELHLKKDHAYKFELTSKDVIHNFNIPEYVVLWMPFLEESTLYGSLLMRWVSSIYNAGNIAV